MFPKTNIYIDILISALPIVNTKINFFTIYSSIIINSDGAIVFPL